MSEDTTQPHDPSDDPTRSFTTDPAPDSARGEPTLPAGTVIGTYTIESLLGTGGMGAVYRATQQRPARAVALKLMRPGLTSPRALRRFELEAELLGRLSHPGIASIYEAGIFTDHHGRDAPFFAMELVDAVTLREYAQRHTLSTNDRLALFAKVCDAVHHAHAKGIIHRDLKPSNILVTTDPNTGEPQPKILDFGVARATDADVTSATMQTEVGQIVGTLPYMSPEQVVGDPSDIDTRSDVYALGVVLFELLAGRLPYDLQRAMVAEAARVIREDDPDRLSTIDTRLRGDIETIVAKALEKERERRYQSALDLGSDLRRYLNNEPITARPPSTWYQLRKFTRRNKPLVAGIALAFIALTAGLAAATYGLLEADTQRQIASDRADEAIEAREAAEDALADANAARAEEAKRAEELEQVAQFQSQQLSGIDPPTMGLKLREDLLEKFRARDDRAGYDEEEIQARLAELDESLNGVDFTGMALTTLEENIFKRAIEAIDEQFADQPLVQARLLQTVAATTQKLGLLELATNPQTQALEIRRRELGDDDPHTLDSITAMGILLDAQGKPDMAESFRREAAEGFQRVLGEEHPSTLISLANLGTLLQDQGRLAEAEPYTKKVLEIRRRVLGDKHSSTLSSVHNMARLLMAQGKLNEAEQYWREALHGRRQVLGDEHPQTLITIMGLGVLLQSQGKLEEAESYYQESVESCRRVFGNDHPETLAAIGNMGVFMVRQGKLNEAEPFFLEALESSKRMLGDEHPNTLASIGNMGAMLQDQGRFDEAEPYWRAALNGFRRVLGEDHPHTLASINNMGVLLNSQGKHSEAELFVREAIESHRRVLGNKHPRTLETIKNMGRLLREQGKLSQAEPYMIESLEGFRNVLGVDHQFTLDSIRNIIDLYHAMHKADPAAGHDTKAAHYQAQLDQILAQQSSQPAED